jgi:hypothetical protein
MNPLHHLKARPGVIAFLQKAGIVAGAAISAGIIIGFVWRHIEAPVYAYALALDAKHTRIEEQLTALIAQHDKDDERQRQDMKELVQIVAAPPDSPERARRARVFVLKH